jgi:RNA polymerase sigma-70 factor, ECF subfamily
MSDTVFDRAPDEAVGKVYLEHQGRVFRAAYRITGNVQDAEDVLQTVFLRLLRRDDDALELAQNLGSYLHRAAVNAALDVLRRRRTAGSVDLDEVGPTLVDLSPVRPDEVHRAAELRSWLRRAVARLSDRAAEMFALRYFEGYDNPEIARMLGTSKVAVAVTLTRTRHRLRREFRRTMGGRR